jgi:sterol desaturase/sphingolipid hydroxylase (fatty acid hydroxylase superfamily)
MITEMASISIRTVCFVALVGSILWPLEYLFPRIRIPFSVREVLTNVGWLLLGAFTLQLTVGPFLNALSISTSKTVSSLCLALVGAEFMAYFSHRAMHHFEFLWKFHSVHHAPGELHWTCAWRQHPVDVAFHALAVGLPGALLGAPLSGLATLIVFRRLWTSFLHANLRFSFPILELVISTPRFHHAHHERGHVNFAGFFSVLDSMFGTSDSKRNTE